jgi:anthranilate phosphoribosyltransferase
MDLRPIIKEVGRGAHGARELPADLAEQLFGELLDGAVGELELGAILMAYRIKGETEDELRGFARALAARTAGLVKPGAASGGGGAVPVLLPSYNGARKLPNLTPLLALLLARRGIPVVVHGISESFGRTTTEAIFKAMNLPPAASLDDAARQLTDRSMTYIPLHLLAPGLDRLIAARERIGLRGSGHTVAKLLDPFAGNSVLVVPVTHPDYLGLMRTYLKNTAATALLFRGHEGEPTAGPKRPLEADVFVAGRHAALASERPADIPLPEAIDAATTARWTEEALAGRTPVPATLVRLADWCEAASRGRLPQA